MPIIAKNPKYRGYPSGWYVWDANVKTVPFKAFGFHGTKITVNRFGARYRAATSFRRIEFDNLAQPTADGYTALCKLLLTYSAFEYLCPLIGTKTYESNDLLNGDERKTVLGKLRSLNPDFSICKFLHTHTRGRVKEELANYLATKECNPLIIAAAIRHVFAHGTLTAKPDTIERESLRAFTNYLSRVLIKVMNREFEARVNRVKELLEAL